MTVLSMTTRPLADEAPRTQTAQPMVRFRDVCKSYGSFSVLNHLDLEVGANEKVAICCAP